MAVDGTYGGELASVFAAATVRMTTMSAKLKIRCFYTTKGSDLIRQALVAIHTLSPRIP